MIWLLDHKQRDNDQRVPGLIWRCHLGWLILTRRTPRWP